MPGQIPASGRVAPYPPTPPSLNMFLALCAPLSFSVRLPTEISGMMSASGQRPRVWSPPGCGGGKAEVDGAHPAEFFCVCRPGLRWHQLHIRQFHLPGHRLGLSRGSLGYPLRRRDALASRWHHVVRSLQDLGLSSAST